jgi:hypothetical protein
VEKPPPKASHASLPQNPRRSNSNATTTITEIDQSYKLRAMAEPQIRPVDDSQLPVSNSSLMASQRLPNWTLPTTQGYIPRPFFQVGNGQCTHLTMTRLYTTEFRCSLCLRVGSMGWIYRCTQDRDLLIEDDMERGNEVSNDKVCAAV